MPDAFTELLRTRPQYLIGRALEAELSVYMVQLSGVRTEAGHATVVRNGHHPVRPSQTSIDPVSVRTVKRRCTCGISLRPCVALCK